MVERIADLVVAESSKDSALLPKLSAQLTDIQKRLANLLKAVEAGIFNDTTQQRMTELERQKQKLEIEIAKEKLKKSNISREDVAGWLYHFRELDVKKEKHRRILIDSFVNAVYVYDDKITLTFNYREGTETISLAQVESSDLCCDAPPTKSLHYPRIMQAFCWWSITTQIRTFHLRKRNGFCALSIVKRQGNFIIIHIYRVDKRINQNAAMFFLFHIQFTKMVQPTSYILARYV